MLSSRPAAFGPSPHTRLPHVLAATLLVAGSPLAIVLWLRASETISSVLVCVVLGFVLSLCTSQIACMLWAKRPGSEDLLFSELMIWGFVHRLRTQRRLESARDLLGPVGSTHALGGESKRQRARLLEGLVAGIEKRDPYLHGHSRRVARHSWMIAKRMGLPSAEVARIRTAAAIHDVGKVETPKAILHKRGRLTDEEYEIIKLHPLDGALAARVLGDTELAAIIRHHHERLDGTGYPGALAGQQIPLGARIVAVADTFDAITSTRPYRAASSHEEAISILRSEAGTQLDPAAVRAFCSHYAGRRSLALWATLAALPERFVSWLGGGAAGVASTAKAVAVALLAGGTAATVATLAVVPVVVSHPHRAASRSGAAVSGPSATVQRPPSLLGAPRSRAGKPVQGGAPDSGPAGPATAAAATGSTPAGPPSIGSGEGAAPGSGAGPAGGITAQRPGTGAVDEAHSKVTEAGSTAGVEVSGKGAEAQGKEVVAKTEETHVKVEETVSKATAPQAPVEETVGAVKSKVEEAKEVVGKL